MLNGTVRGGDVGAELKEVRQRAYGHLEEEHPGKGNRQCKGPVAGAPLATP